MRDPVIWGLDAEQFRPQRFEKLTMEQSMCYYSFVIGKDSCPARLIAELEASLVITQLFLRYDVEIIDPKIKPYSIGTLRLSREIPVKLTLRS